MSAAKSIDVWCRCRTPLYAEPGEVCAICGRHVPVAGQPNPEPGGPCPKCDGEGGRFADECPSLTTEWIECKSCDGSGEYWPEGETSLNSERRGALVLAAVEAGLFCACCGMIPKTCDAGHPAGCHPAKAPS